MHNLDRAAQAAEFALDIHQTAHIAADHGIRSGIDNILDFVGYHRI